MRRLLAVCIILSLGACGHPAAPGPIAPAVAGLYTGTLAWTVSGHVFEPQRVSVSVAQVGSKLTITGTLHFPLDPGQLPAVSCDLDPAGVAACAPAVAEDPTCGEMRGQLLTATFVENRLIYSATSATRWCGFWMLRGELSR